MVKYEYDVWGNVTYTTLSFGTTSAAEEQEVAKVNPFRYRGYYYDEESGLYYLLTRYYDPWTGQFISPDSLNYLTFTTIGSSNSYTCYKNNPIMYVDSIGCFAIPIGESIVGCLKDLFAGFGGALLKKSAAAFDSLANVPPYILDDIGGAVWNTEFLQGMTKATNLEYSGKILNAFGKIAKVASYVLLAADIGISIYNNFANENLSLSRKITDSIVDVSFLVGGFFIGMKAGALLGSVGGPIGIVLGAVAGLAIGIGIWAFQTFAADIYNDIKVGFNTFIMETIPNAWNKFVSGWNYFWSFSWAV